MFRTGAFGCGSEGWRSVTGAATWPETYLEAYRTAVASGGPQMTGFPHRWPQHPAANQNSSSASERLCDDPPASDGSGH
jgi:hypothetical protein